MLLTYCSGPHGIIFGPPKFPENEMHNFYINNNNIYYCRHTVHIHINFVKKNIGLYKYSRFSNNNNNKISQYKNNAN